METFRTINAARVMVGLAVLIVTTVVTYASRARLSHQVSTLRLAAQHGDPARPPRVLSAPTPADFLHFDVSCPAGPISLSAPSTWVRQRTDEDHVWLELMSPEGVALSLSDDPTRREATIDELMDQAPNELSPLFTSLNVTAAEVVRVGHARLGRLEYRAVGRVAGQSHETRIVQYLRLVGHTQYALTLFTLPDQFAFAKPVAEQVAASWHVPGE